MPLAKRRIRQWRCRSQNAMCPSAPATVQPFGNRTAIISGVSLAASSRSRAVCVLLLAANSVEIGIARFLTSCQSYCVAVELVPLRLTMWLRSIPCKAPDVENQSKREMYYLEVVRNQDHCLAFVDQLIRFAAPRIAHHTSHMEG